MTWKPKTRKEKSTLVPPNVKLATEHHWMKHIIWKKTNSQTNTVLNGTMHQMSWEHCYYHYEFMMMMSVPRNRPPVFIFMVIVFSALMFTFVISRCNQEVQNQEHNYKFHHDHIGCQLRPHLLNCMHTWWKGIKWWVSWIVNRCMQFVCLYMRCHFLDDLNTTQSSNKCNLWWFFF